MPVEHYRARYVFPVETDPLVDGLVSVDQGRIVDVRGFREGDSITDLGDVAILPALVNAHTHLEFSALDTPLHAGAGFAEWIRQVINYRQERDATNDLAVCEAIQKGIQECATTGTGLLGEIATSPTALNLYDSRSPRAVVFRELLGTSHDRVVEGMKVAREHVALAARADVNWKPGLSPHAPYSTHVDLVRQSVHAAIKARCPVAMHLAETLDELELLASHSGPIVELLKDFGVWNPSAVPRGINACDYLKMLSAAPRALIIHGNYLQPIDWELLARNAGHMSVVYCPRTHAGFGHGEYPLAELLDSGVRVAVGTDSRASNPDLNLLHEIRFVIDRHPNVSPETILRIATLNGAQALGFNGQFGSIAVGKRARFVLLALGNRGNTDPYDLLADESTAFLGNLGPL